MMTDRQRARCIDDVHAALDRAGLRIGDVVQIPYKKNAKPYRAAVVTAFMPLGYSVNVVLRAGDDRTEHAAAHDLVFIRGAGE
ncbi:MAG: hypothetical protein IMY86_13815 [Chloroflexi bacterium]|nr:hypothetical protein [Chloroflexota bacterium]